MIIIPFLQACVFHSSVRRAKSSKAVSLYSFERDLGNRKMQTKIYGSTPNLLF